MEEPRIDLVELLKRYAPSPLGNLQAAYLYEDNTPAHKYINVIAEIFDTPYYILTTARDFFDPELGISIVQYVRQQAGMISFSADHQITDTFASSGYGFNTMLFLGPDAHSQLKNVSEILHVRTTVGLPIFHCEFSSTDSLDLIKMVRSRFVPTLDWKREPSPRVWMRFSNAITHSIGKKLGIIGIEIALKEIHRIPLGPDGWAELENYLRDHIRITYADGLYRLEKAGETLLVPDVELDDRVRQFLCP